MAGFILLMRFLSKSYSVKLNDKLTVGVGCPDYEFGKTGFESRNYFHPLALLFADARKSHLPP